jgi:hypothetical protein
MERGMVLGRCAVLAVFWVVWMEMKKIIFVEARCEDVDYLWERVHS